MKHRKDFSKAIAHAGRLAMCLMLTAILFAVPAFADSATGSTTAPFYFTPIGMTVILIAVALCVVGIVALIRAQKRKNESSEPTVIPLEPKLPETTNAPASFEEDVARYAKEEAEKEAAKDRKELNRAINEVLYAETLADWREKQTPAAETQTEKSEEKPEPAATPVTLPAPEGEHPVAIEEPEAEDISGDLADRVERRVDSRIDADDVDDRDEDPLTIKATAYHTAFEEAKNVSADTEDAIELVDTEDEEDGTPAEEPCPDIAPTVTSELAEELEQTEQPLENTSDEEVTEAVADIRDSVLAADEEPIELVEEPEEEAEEEPVPEEPEITADEEPVEETVEEPVEEPLEVQEEEPAAAAFAEITEDAEEEPEEEDADEEEDDSDEDDGEDAEQSDAAVANFGGQRIVYIDAKANPEAYAELLEREARGEVTLVYRYRKSFLSKMAMAEESVKGYYNEVKNALLAYKGVKCRTSWGYEAFNKGRAKIARMDVKTKSLYLYLAIDPASLVDTKYTFKDMSAKKKYAATPVLMKIRGERKFKHALELIEKICGEELQLKRLEAEPVDYRLPMMTQDEMVEAGYMKMMVGAIPTHPEEPADMEPAEPTAAEVAETAEGAESAAEPAQPEEAAVEPAEEPAEAAEMTEQATEPSTEEAAPAEKAEENA